MIDATTPFGERAARRLREEIIGWLVTVRADGTPQPSPIWFLWEDETFLIYSRPATPKLRNIAQNPRVAINLDSAEGGDDIVIVSGEAHVSDDPPAGEVPLYVEKYESSMHRLD